MPFRVDVEVVEGVAIITPRGRISLGEGDQRMQRAVLETLERGCSRIVLMLGDVMYVDSSGLGSLFSAFTWAKNRGGDLVFAGLTKRIKDLLMITKLYTVVETYETMEQALAHFGVSPPKSKAADGQP
ncbi:MAG TPA: STAS domain-containing protein [Bryobacteraceae bacterium]